MYIIKIFSKSIFICNTVLAVYTHYSVQVYYTADSLLYLFMVETTKEIVEKFVFALFRGRNNMMPILYYFPPSPPCRAVLLLGKMIGLDFDLRSVSVLEGEQLKPDYVQVK